jgi:ceramide glucosyltransferase
MLIFVKVGLLISLGISLAFYFTCAFCVYRFFTTSRPLTVSEQPPVSILVPVCNLEEGAWDNWLSFCHQDYPHYEVLFGAVDPKDPAIPVLKELAEKFPDRVRVFWDLIPRGINHKDSSLSYLVEACKHEVIIFADSDIRVTPDYIRTVTAPLSDPKVGLVTCVYTGSNPQSLGAAMASLGRCCDFIPSILIAQMLDGGLRFAIGVTIATRKATLADIGGLHFNRIGSDYNLGKRASQAGYKIVLSPDVLESDTGRETVGEVFRRELRWARTIRYNRGNQYYTMMFCYGLVYALLLLVVSNFQAWAIALTLCTLAIRYALALLVVWKLRLPKLRRWLWALPLRDLLSYAIWVMGTFGRGVYWRGRRLQVKADGLLAQSE